MHRRALRASYRLALGLALSLLSACEDESSSGFADAGFLQESSFVTPDAAESVEPPTGPEALCAALPTACEPAVGARPSVGPRVDVIPGASLPSAFDVQLANNNLDVVWHEGRLFLAWRTAPFHYASADTHLYVASTEDLVTWRYEGEFALDTDVREPQLVSFRGSLLLYFAVLGDNPMAFEPQGSRLSAYRSPGEWSDPAEVFDGDFIPWRIRSVGDRLEAFGYTGGGGIYDVDTAPLEVLWLASDDGVAWESAIPGGPAVLVGGASETDAGWLDDGTLVAIARNEAGDETGFGSRICRASREAPAAWTCAADPRKFDSPLVIARGDDAWLIARRNVTESGAYDLGRDDLPFEDRYLTYQLEYWGAPKRCALWRIDPVELSVEHVLDLPSRGDTCFPEALDLGEGRFLVFDYSSPLDGEDLAWQPAQVGPTRVYRTLLSLP